MNINNAKEYIENSFLKELIEDENITDISFNGEYLFYQSNITGRNQYKENISYEEIENFIKQLSYLSEKNFSFSNPILDVSFDRYRITAIYNSICKRNFKSVINFSIRIASKKLRINSESSFFNSVINEFFIYCLHNRKSILIGGITGSGKTEFQKYLLTQIDEKDRVVILDNINELDGGICSLNRDINIWVINENNKDIDFSLLIKTALRSNPDWLILAEAREKEMKDVLMSSQTGHPIISCLHASSLKSILSRVIRMIQIKDQTSNYEIIKSDVLENIDVFVIIDRFINNDGSIYRYIKEIGISDGYSINLIYQKNEKEIYKKIPSFFINQNYKFSKSFYQKFLKEKSK